MSSFKFLVPVDNSLDRMIAGFKAAVHAALLALLVAQPQPQPS
jgi:hypothetical protein